MKSSNLRLNRRASTSRELQSEDLDQPDTAKTKMSKWKFPSTLSVAAQSHLADYILLAVLVVVTVISETATPFSKVFYTENDLEYWKYSYPLHQKNTVPSWTVPVIATLVPLFFIILVSAIARPSQAELHKVILGLLTSVFVTATLTNLIKIGVGRPRPNFMARCFPDGKSSFTEAGIPTCAPDAVDPSEGRKSFPSGHTSWSTSGLGYLSIWLVGQLRCFDGSGHPARLILAALPLCTAGYIGITRLQDYWHHWEDVLAGFLLGCTVAYLSYRQHFPGLLSANSGEAYVNNHVGLPAERAGWQQQSDDIEMGGSGLL